MPTSNIQYPTSQEHSEPVINIGLFCPNKNHRGPGKVVTNLLKGFAQMEENIQVITNPDNRSLGSVDHIGILQPVQNIFDIPERASRGLLFGPNIINHPGEAPDLFKKYNHFIVPSQWYKDMYMDWYGSVLDEEKHKIHICPVGIDTVEWKPVSHLDETEKMLFEEREFAPLDCFIYYKNRNYAELTNLVSFLNKHFPKLKYKIIEYDHYAEEDLKLLCWRSKFAFVLDNTESQGIATLEIMATDTPLYVFDWKSWPLVVNGKVAKSYPATSVPYFEPGICGEKNTSFNKEHLTHFIDNVAAYKPREYILNNLSLKKCSEHYFELLKSAI